MINTKLVSFRSFEHYKCFSVCWKQTCNTLYHISVHCSDFPLHSCRKGDKNVQMKLNSIVFCVSVLSMWQTYSMRLCFIYSKCSSSSSLLVAHFCALSSVLVPGYISSKRFSSLLFTFLISSFFLHLLCLAAAVKSLRFCLEGGMNSLRFCLSLSGPLSCRNYHSDGNARHKRRNMIFNRQLFKVFVRF